MLSLILEHLKHFPKCCVILFIKQGSHKILEIKFHDFSHDFPWLFYDFPCLLYDFLQQLLHLFYDILCKLHSTYVDSVEVIIFSENETKLESCVFKESWKPKN